MATESQPICEFVVPCMAGPSSDGHRFRKVRCRYRAAEWPFTQCELLLQTLDRMEMWGQVRSFELRLRLRETRRRNEESPEPGSTTGLPERGRHSRTITAPVPEWLQEEVGADKSFYDIRHLIQRIRQYLLESERDQQEQQALGSTTPSSQGPRRGSSAHVMFPDIEIISTFGEDTHQPNKPSSSARHTQSQSARAQMEDDRAGEEASASRGGRQSQGPRPRGSRVPGRGTVRKLRDDDSQ
ncbi:Uncharacterized protein PECH_002350 [Penicillium ucsense]|uniref:Uncharacterized protein n=1 Tax=Penicillium ucsense TaxID=2839758 RepID=A0A8J8WHA0_9EURO|nr:Uncharacterized protein PECM_001939 [Penicillium ucsense]KAF7730933.1 Uncharacterized protein PECH_002350 [Penicillium ucsense]